MTSGRKFSKREEKYIRAHHKGMFASIMAKQLCLLYPDDNGGERDSESIKRFMKRKGIK